jgi:AcrR family transcriptional regulator
VKPNRQTSLQKRRDGLSPDGFVADARNASGQAMGAKGQGTRLRLIEATVALLQNTTLSGLRVADIAAMAGTSPAAFYKYFPDVSAAALAAAEACKQSTDALLRLASEDWTEAQALQRAKVFVDLYINTWESNAAILRVRNLAAEAGDARFGAAREHAVRPLQDALAVRIARGQSDGRMQPDLHPNATAGALIALLERISAVSRVPSEQVEITGDRLKHATAYILARSLPAMPG